jgi:hypothetical protein
MPYRRLLASFLTCAVAAQALADPLTLTPNGKPQRLTAHRPPRMAPVTGAPLATPVPNAEAGLGMPYTGTPIDVLTYHYDQGRTGWNPAETALTPSTVSGGKFGLLKTLKVDGNVFAEPLLVSNFAMPDGKTRSVLIVATGHNSVYAFDAQSYALLWKVSLGTPQSTSDVGCTDVQPEYGISSTPVIVRSGAGTATLYVVAATEPKSFVFQHTLHALDLGTGKDTVTPSVIAPSATGANGLKLSFDPQNQWNRAGLVYANGTIYVGIGSHCDNNSGGITGWLAPFSPALTPGTPFHTIEHAASTELASIWMSGFAPSVDPNGNIFVVTGNGKFDGKQDFGESALGLSPDLSHVLSYFTPKGSSGLNSNDYDFGSGGIMLVPALSGQAAPPLAVAIGKESILYLLSQAALGGAAAPFAVPLQSLRLGAAGGGTRGGPAFINGDAGPLVYVQVTSDVLRAYRLNTGKAPTLKLHASGTTTGGYGGSTPIVSSNGATAGTGIVWLIRRSDPLTLEAYDADKLGAPIYSAGAGTWSNPSLNAFLTPLEANGRVYVPAYKTVSVFGLTP